MGVFAELKTRAATAEDEAFLRRLFVETNATLQTLPEALLAQLAEMQYRARALSYAAAYPGAEDTIVLLDGEPVGRLLVAKLADRVQIVDLAIVPAAQGRGVGGALVRGVCRKAAAANLAVTLTVQRYNSALRLYERAGFVVTQAAEMDVAMRWVGGEERTGASATA